MSGTPSSHAPDCNCHECEPYEEWLVSGTPSSEQRDELAEVLAAVYLPKGVELWLAHADRQGWSYEERLARALAMAEGNFS